MTRLMTIVLATGAVALPGLALAEEVTTTVGGREMTYVATPQAPAVQISPEQALEAAKQAKPSKPRVHIDPDASTKAPTLK